jgi:hypothetical protein
MMKFLILLCVVSVVLSQGTTPPNGKGPQKGKGAKNGEQRQGPPGPPMKNDKRGPPPFNPCKTFKII